MRDGERVERRRDNGTWDVRHVKKTGILWDLKNKKDVSIGEFGLDADQRFSLPLRQSKEICLFLNAHKICVHCVRRKT